MDTQEIIRGDTYDQQVLIKDQADDVVDLTGATVILTFRDFRDNVLGTKTVTSHSDPINGITIINFPKAETLLFKIGIWKCDIEVEISTGEKWTAIRQMMLVSRDQTR